MNHAENEILHTRLRRVERMFAILAGAWVVSAAMLVSFTQLVPMAASQPQVIRTRGIEITDAAGRLRLSLDAVNNAPAVWLYDSVRRRRLGLRLSAFDTPSIVLNDQEGRPRIEMSLGLARAAEIKLTDSRGRIRVWLSVTHQDEPGVWLYANLERPGIGLKVLSGGQARLWVFDNRTGHLLFSAP